MRFMIANGMVLASARRLRSLKRITSNNFGVTAGLLPTVQFRFSARGSRNGVHMGQSSCVAWVYLKQSIGIDAILRAYAAFLLVAVAGCSALPVIVPDMAPRPSGPVQLDGSHGPLSAQQSKAILARLKSRGEDTSIFDRHLAVEEAIVGTPLVVGNKVVLLQDGPATFRAMLTAIRGARDHIHMETYIIEDDEVGRKFADALIEKQAQGVQVTLIYDSVGTLSVPKAFFKHLTDNGVKVLEFNPDQSADGQEGLGSQPARPPQAPDHRRPDRVSRRHQHQQRLFGGIFQLQLEAAPRWQPAMA